MNCSIMMDRLYEIESYPFDVYYGDKEPGEYYSLYEELISELQGGATEALGSFNDAVSVMRCELPCNGDAFSKDRGVMWLETFIALLSDYEMIEALTATEDDWYDGDDEDAVYLNMLPSGKRTRQDAFRKLTKRQMITAFAYAFNAMWDFARVDNAFRTVVSVIEGLEEHNE